MIQNYYLTNLNQIFSVSEIHIGKVHTNIKKSILPVIKLLNPGKIKY